MQLEHSFTVPADIDTAWKTLLDVQRIAMCMPGASLTSVEGDTFTGEVKVKLGPISMTYGGRASFTEKDAAGHRAVITASGSETKGTSTANATVVTQLVSEGSTTRVDVTTDLAITGKPAQFGRGVMQDVAGRIIDQFADNLATLVASSSSGEAPVHPIAAEALYIGAAAGAPLLKRVLPVAAIVAVIAIIIFALT